MADIAINFRATSGYATDAAGETYCLQEGYPTTRGGYTFGYTSGIANVNTRDRDNTLDRRITGTHWISASAQFLFRIDLGSTGTKNVYAGFGDPGNTAGNHFEIRDNTTTLATIDDSSVSSANTLDASGAEISHAAWAVAGGTSVSLTFSTTTFTIQANTGLSDGDVSGLQHLKISDAGGGGTTDGVLSVSGTGATSLVGKSTASSLFSSAGVGAASFVGKSTASSPFSSSAQGNASFIGAAASSGTLAVTSTGAALFSGVGLNVGSFSAVGTSSLSLIGKSTFNGILSAPATSSVFFNGNSAASSRFSSLATSVVSFIGSAGDAAYAQYIRRYLNDIEILVPTVVRPIRETRETSDLDDYFRNYLNDLGGDVALVRFINVQDAPYSAIGDGIVNDFDAFSEAATVLAANVGGTLFVPAGTYRISNNLTIPYSVEVVFMQGAMLSIDFGIIVTFNENFQASLRHVFSGSGSVVINKSRDIFPQWWGAVADNLADDTVPSQKAVNSIVSCGGCVVFIHGRFKITAVITISSIFPITLKGEMFGQLVDGCSGIYLGANIAGPMFKYIAPDPANREASGGGVVKNLAFIGASDRSLSCTAALYLSDFVSSKVSDCVFKYIKGSALLCEFLVMSEISNNTILYCGNSSQPAIDISNSDGVHIAQSLQIFGNRLEVNFDAEYIKIGASPLDISIIDNRFEADTAIAESNGQFINSAAFFGKYSNNNFNRNTGTQVTISGAGNSLKGNKFCGGPSAEIPLVMSGGRNIVNGNNFDGSTRTGVEVSLAGDVTFSGNEMYFAGGIACSGFGCIVKGNIIIQSSLTSGFWIDASSGSGHIIEGNILDNNGGPISTVGGIKTHDSNIIKGNVLRSFYGTGNGIIGIRIESSGNIIANNQLNYAPFSIANYDNSFEGNIISNVPDAVEIPLYITNVAYNPPSLNASGLAGNTAVTTVAVPGAAIYDECWVQFSVEASEVMWRAYCDGTVVQVIVVNISNSTVDLGAGILTIKVKKKWN